MVMNINISLMEDFHFAKPINFWCKAYIIIPVICNGLEEGQ